jgi:hypothetical protein
VLVDHRGPHAVVSHASFQVGQADPRLRRQGVTDMPQIMKCRPGTPIAEGSLPGGYWVATGSVGYDPAEPPQRSSAPPPGGKVVGTVVVHV